jgi:D-alanyl-D-alanine carboxypeptidase
MVKELAESFGVSDSEVSVPYVFEGQALGGQVFWVKPKAGATVKSSAFANSRYVVYQCKSDKELRVPLLQPGPLETNIFLDKSWWPQKPKFLPMTGGQTDIKNCCTYLPYFGEYEWDNADYSKVADQDAIVIRGSWKEENISDVPIPQVKGIPGGMGGRIMFNNKAAWQLKGLWKAWEQCGLLSKVIDVWGYVARYQRPSGGPKHAAISNHAFGTAFDINTKQNLQGHEPARLGEYGCVREMVEVAHKFGFYWGGHFGGGRVDGMHFEVAKVM